MFKLLAFYFFALSSM